MDPDHDGIGDQRLTARDAGVHGLALAGVGEVVDVEELLGAEVEGAGQLAGEEAPVTGGEATGDAIEGGLVQGDDEEAGPQGEGGKDAGCCGRREAVRQGAALPRQPMHPSGDLVGTYSTDIPYTRRHEV